MSSDFNFTVTSSFLRNVRVKPYFNTQCPCEASGASSNQNNCLFLYVGSCEVKLDYFINLLDPW